MINNMGNDQESHEFWSTLLQFLTDSDPKDDLNSPKLVMSTSMAIDISPEPSNALGGGDKPRPGKDVDELGDKNINEDRMRFTGKQTEKAKEEGEKEEMKNLSKRQRNEARNIVEKRRRTDIKTKIENLAQLIPNCKKGDIATTLECIVDSIRSMKLYVESTGPMLPLGLNMDFPVPWFPYYMHPNFMMPPPPFSGFIQGEISGIQQSAAAENE
ncbi:unnamed protein product [Thlaspi arvense]|uniref:BHLH domain-containing protein n=1 Tax=Thlaspi arvense TaxID=13288 RepID=A0AAU9SM04_THLAR|nr:unnamed protein product [Thlaspi arvense]